MFLKSDYKYLNNDILKKLCKNADIKNYSKFKKNELFEIINKSLAVKIIQQNFRNHFYKDATDHITLDPVTFPCFIYKTKSGKHYFYNHSSIIKYIMKTAVYLDPMTREEYSDNDLRRLDSEAKLYYPNIKYRSTYKIKKNLAYAHRIRNRENEILSFQMRLDELKEQVLFIIVSDMYNWVLGNEPLLIENIEYQTIDSFVQAVFHELKMVLLNLRIYDTPSSVIFKNDLVRTINELNCEQTNLIELVNNL
jgi:hypothetical protein